MENLLNVQNRICCLMSMKNKRAIGKIAVAVIVVILVAAIAAGVYVATRPGPAPSESPSPSASAKPVKNPDTIIEATIGEPETLDPAWAYDTASGEVIFNIYDTLIFFNRVKVDDFIPKIASQVPSVDNGLVRDGGKTIIFPIRQGIKTHSGGTITPEDVEYSFERAMIQDRDGGPVWMIFEPLLGVESLSELGNLTDPTEAAQVGQMIDNAVQVDGNNVVFKLAKPYPLTTFLQIWSQTWASIVDKETAIQKGAWPGNKDNWVQVFEKYHNPQEPELQEADCGSGPFMLQSWEHGKEVSLVRFDDYWAGPAKIKGAVIKMVDEWATRKLMFQQGDADIAYVPRQYASEVEGLEGIRVVKNLPTLQLDNLLFTFSIDSTSEYIGSGKLDGNGVPTDFFADINLRKAFAYAFDWDTYIKDAMLGEAKHIPGPIPEGLPYFNPDQPMYTFNMTLAEEYFKKAMNGTVWETGFTFDVLYNTGNVPRKTAAEIIKANVESLNPKFHINVRAVEWPTYLKALVGSKLPLFIIGWQADFPDPHNFVHPYMHSNGAYASAQGYNNTEVDKLIEEGISETDPAKRQTIYYQLQSIYYEDVPSVVLDQPLARHWERDWVQGWYYNPIYPGIYFYDLSKGY